VARRSHRMQKHKFGVTCPDALFVEIVLRVSCHGRIEMHYVTCRSHRM
jgi:hypothetical protein